MKEYTNTKGGKNSIALGGAVVLNYQRFDKPLNRIKLHNLKSFPIFSLNNFQLSKPSNLDRVEKVNYLWLKNKSTISS